MPIFTKALPRATLIASMLLATAPLRAEFTGLDWLNSSADLKRGVVLGALTIVDAERAFQQADSSCDSAAPTLVRGLGHTKAPALEQALEAYYRDKPDERNRSIFHAIWAIALKNSR